MTSEFIQRVKDIPNAFGSEGYWKQATEDYFMRTAESMLAHGYTEDEVIAMLTDLYSVVSDEFGN